MIKSSRKTKKVDEHTSKVHQGLRVFFGYSLYKSGMLFRDLVDFHHVERFGLTAPECGILFVLSTSKAINQLSLGQELGIDKATIVKMIDKLENLNLVKREVDRADRRSRFVSLTTYGKNQLEKIKKVRNEIEEIFFAKFSSEDANHLKRLVPQMLEVLMNNK